MTAKMFHMNKKTIVSQSACLCLVCFSLIFSSCTFYSKEDYLKDFESFVDKTKNNCKDYDKEDWVKADQQYSEYAVTLFKKFELELTTEENAAVNKLKGRYLYLKTKEEADNFLDKAKNVLDQAEGIIEELTDTSN